MFYKLLDLIVCPFCHSPLINLVLDEELSSTYMRLENASRVNQAGVIVGPFPDFSSNSEIVRLLKPFESSPAFDGRDKKVKIVSAILICPQCEHWFPVRDSLPELLPDYLRDHELDQVWLEAFENRLENAGLGEVYKYLLNRQHQEHTNISDSGYKYKKAEMEVTKRNLPEGFFGPALIAPFQPLRPSFSLDLILRFGTTVQKLNVGINALIMDIGVGYGWTSEWLVRLGYRVIGIDICRDYILAGIPRMQPFVPYLIVADIENLPLKSEIVDSILSFDAFHHIPNRNKAMREFDRVMKPGGRISLVEPGKDHEHHPQSIAVMEQHGILEVGMDKKDIGQYITSTALENVIHYTTDAHPHNMFVVHKKGQYRPDSRSPRSLLATIDIKSDEHVFHAQNPFILEISLKNSGDTTWLYSTEDHVGEVKLGAHLFDQDRNLIKTDFFRCTLPRNIEPDNECNLKCNIPAIHQPGEYILELDMVVEGLVWFKDFYYNAKDFRFTIVSKDTPIFTSEKSDTSKSCRLDHVGSVQKELNIKHKILFYAKISVRTIKNEGLIIFFKKAWKKVLS